MANTAMRLRFISRILVVTLVVLVGAVIVIRDRMLNDQASARPSSTQPAGKLDLGGAPAPAFALKDQSGVSVSLADLRGEPVVLTFLYTHCPDVCPLTAEKLHTSVLALGDKASRVAWVAVSVDPAGDMATDADAFVAQHHLTGHLRYLLGSSEQLQPIWDAYHVAVRPAADPMARVGDVSHVVGVYVLDAQGREQAFFDSSFTSDEVVTELSGLLGR